MSYLLIIRKFAHTPSAMLSMYGQNLMVIRRVQVNGNLNVVFAGTLVKFALFSYETFEEPWWNMPLGYPVIWLVLSLQQDII